MELSEVTRKNFKEIRTKYHISATDVAKRAKLSKAVISRFESNDKTYSTGTNTRNYNGFTIISTLVDMINEGYTSDMMRKGHGRNATDIPSDKFVEYIVQYCDGNTIEARKMLEAIGFGRSYYYDHRKETYRISKSNYLLLEQLKMVIDFTGWTEEHLREEINNMSWIPAKHETETPKTEEKEKVLDILPNEYVEEKEDKRLDHLLNGETTTSKEIRNKKFIFDGNNYVVEYEVVEHKKQIISREEFLTQIDIIAGKKSASRLERG
jgi:transcriptional regulator with XRE-family HTH domain